MQFEGLIQVKRTMSRVLCELLRDSSKSDRELAKVLGVSQPTVSRLRNRLVEDGLIQHFTVIPDLKALGFELIAVTSLSSKDSKEIEERARRWTMAKPNVLFAARVDGNRRNGLMISLHKNYTDYHNFISEVKSENSDAQAGITDYDTMFVSLEGSIVKPFSPRYIAELLEPSKD